MTVSSSFLVFFDSEEHEQDIATRVRWAAASEVYKSQGYSSYTAPLTKTNYKRRL